MSTPPEHQFTDGEVPCLLLPVTFGQLLLPTVTIAEMMPYQSPQPKTQKTPPWFLGDLFWRGLTIPLVSFEQMTGRDSAAVGDDSQVAVFNHTGVNDQLPFLAIPTTGIPRLSRITSEEIVALTKVEVKPYEIMHVSISGGEAAIIPDVSALESACVELLGL